MESQHKVNSPLGIIFDLGDTVLEYEENNPERGTKKLLEICHNPEAVTVNRIQEFVKILTKETFLKRDETELEISFQSFQRLLYETHKISFDADYDEVERIFCKYAYVSRPSCGIRELLQLLRRHNIRIGALSNSCFTGTSLRYELKQHDLDKYFDFIISSADYCLRKPNKLLFNLAITKMGLSSERMWFIGDSYRFDMLGAIKAGLFPIWYNKKNQKDKASEEVLEVKSMNQIIEIIEQLKEGETPVR